MASLLSIAGTSHNTSPAGKDVACVVTPIGLASPPTPLRLERGVVCEVTPIGLLRNGEETLNAWMTYRGISVITPLSIRRGAGGEASVTVRFCEIG